MNVRLACWGVQYRDFWAVWQEPVDGGECILGGAGCLETFNNVNALKGAMKEIAPLRKWKTAKEVLF